MLNKIVLLVKTQKNGLRAEEIRSKLGLQAKEMPRILDAPHPQGGALDEEAHEQRAEAGDNVFRQVIGRRGLTRMGITPGR